MTDSTSESELWRAYRLDDGELAKLPPDVADTIAGVATLVNDLREADPDKYHLGRSVDDAPLPFGTFRFLNIWHANGFVDGLDADSCIYLTAALPFALRDFFDLLLFDRRVLQGLPRDTPDLADATALPSLPISYAHLRDLPATPNQTGLQAMYHRKARQLHAIDYRPKKYRVGIGGLSEQPSNDTTEYLKVSTRTALAHKLWLDALLFLLSHEMAHVTEGHLYVRRSLGCAAVIDESGSANLFEGDGLLLQSIECHADLSALARTFPSTDRSRVPRWATFLKDLEPPIEQRVRYWFFAIGVLLMLLERERKELKWYLDKSHPPHRLRLYLIAGWAQKAISSWADDDQSAATRGFRAALSDLNIASEILSIRSVSFAADEVVALEAYALHIESKLPHLRKLLSECRPSTEKLRGILHERLLTKRIELDQGKAASLMERALLRAEQGRLREALQDFQDAAQIDDPPNRLRRGIYYNWAELLYRHRQWSQALGIVGAAVSGDQWDEINIMALTLKGRLLAALERPNEAYACWSAALDDTKNPQYPSCLIRPLLARAQFELQKGNPATAIKDLRMAVRKGGPKNLCSYAYAELSRAHRQCKAFKSAYRTALLAVSYAGKDTLVLTEALFAKAAASIGCECYEQAEISLRNLKILGVKETDPRWAKLQEILSLACR